MDPQVLVFVLLFAGLALIFAEVFLPSGGIIAVMCVACFGGSLYYAHQAWSASNPTLWWSYVGSLLIIIPAAVIACFKILTNTSLGNHILLTAPKRESVTPYQEEMRRLNALVGKRGKTLNLMTPGGIVLIDGERLHASADGLMIEPQTDVEIVGLQGNRVIVRPVTAITESSDSESEDAESSDVDPWVQESDA